MEIAPLLFDLDTSKPTSRQVADLVKAGGADALTDAVRRPDAARYQEIRCRSALNSCKGMPFAWTLNPYRGCTHGCHYCYARRYHTQFALGTATDCYQPIEGFYKLTRGVLEAFCDFSTPTGVVTKGPMVVRDKDVLVDLSAKTDVTVCISVPCVDEDVWRALEPGTAPPLQRLRAVKELVDSGVRAGVLMSPIVPGVSSKPALIER